MSSSNQSDLYRIEALSAQSENFGSIRLAQPISTLIIALGATLILIALLTYIRLGEVTRKAHVSGVLVPNFGSIGMNSPAAGTVSKIFVHEGATVTAGQALIEISAERQGTSGELGALLSQQLRSREQSLIVERRFRQTQASERLRALDERIRGQRKETLQIEAEIGIATQRRMLAEKTTRKYEALQRDGFVSLAQAQIKQEELLDLDARLATLLRAKAQADSSCEALENEKKWRQLQPTWIWNSWSDRYSASNRRN